MKKIKFTFALLMFAFFATAQIKVKDLPTTTTGSTSDFLLKDDVAGVAGSTKKISVANFLSTYVPSVFISGTINTIPKFASATTIGNSNVTDNGTALTFNENLSDFNTNFYWNQTNATLALSAATNQTPLNILTQSITGGDNSPLIFLNSTWNTSGSPSLIYLNLTNTASGATAKLMDLQVGGASKFNIAKSGSITIADGSQGASKVLVSNASGTGTWTTIGGATGATGDLISFSATNTAANITDVSAGSYLRSGGVSTLPLWSTLKLPNTATANYVPYATSTNTWGESSVLQFDGGQLSVGKKTATGGQYLAVHDSVNGIVTASVTNGRSGTAAGANFFVGNDGNGDSCVSVHSFSRLITPTGDIIKNTGLISCTKKVGLNISSDYGYTGFWTNGSERMRILSTGQVGIGTSTAATTLHVVGTLRFVDGNQAEGSVLLGDGNGTATWGTINSKAWALTGNSGTSYTTNFIGTTDNQSFRIRTNNILTVTIDSLNRIGFGTSLPTAFIHAIGTQPASVSSGNGTNGTTTGGFIRTGGLGGNTTDATAGNIIGGSGGGITDNMAAGGTASSATDRSTVGTSGSYLFLGASSLVNNSTVTTNFTKGGIGSNWQAFIGGGSNASGGAVLSQGGNAGVWSVNNLGVGGGAATGTGQNNTGGNGTVQTFALSNGGAATGAASVKNLGGNGGRGVWTGGNGGAASGNSTNNTSGDGGGGTWTAGIAGVATGTGATQGVNGKFLWNTNGATAFVIDSLGGVRSETYLRCPLFIGGKNTTSALTFRTTTGAGTTNSDFVFQGGNNGATEFARITNAGNLGIGMTPVNVFDVTKNQNGGSYLSILNNDGGANAFSGFTASNGTSGFYFYQGGTGSSTPNASAMTCSGAGGILFYSSSNNSGAVIKFSTNTTERMRVDVSGNVAIGNTAPTQKFEVTGNITIVGGLLYMKDSITPFHYWAGTMTTGILVWTDTGSATKP